MFGRSATADHGQHLWGTLKRRIVRDLRFRLPEAYAEWYHSEPHCTSGVAEATQSNETDQVQDPSQEHTSTSNSVVVTRDTELRMRVFDFRSALIFVRKIATRGTTTNGSRNRIVSRDGLPISPIGLWGKLPKSARPNARKPLKSGRSGESTQGSGWTGILEVAS